MGNANTTTGRAVGLAAFVAVFMIAVQIASKAVRDGFFLSQFDVTALPFATLAAALISFGAALLFGKFLATFSPRAAVPVLFAANGLLFFGEAVLVDWAPRAVAGALYLHTAAFGGAVVSGFWSVINERFDPYTARRVMGRIAGGATFGGVLGGVMTWAFADASNVALLSAFGATSGVCAIAMGFVGRGMPTQRRSAKREPARLLDGFAVLTQSSYPRAIAIIVFLGALMTGTIDYVFKAGVVELEAGATSSLVGFFAAFYTVTGVVTFLLQAFGSTRVLKRLGVVRTVGIFPLGAALMLIAALALPGIVVVVLLRGGLMVIENSLYRSGYELLYTAVPPAQKRSAKVLIDLGCDRIGSAAASGLALLVIAYASNVDHVLLASALAVALTIFAVLYALRTGYVASLGQQLRSALVQPAAHEDALALASTFVADLDAWRHSIEPTADGEASTISMSHEEILRAAKERSVSRMDLGASRPAAPYRPVSEVSDALLDTALRSKIRQTSAEDPGWLELRQSAPGTIGQLGDILLSPREQVSVRIRAAELLATVPSRRSATALLESLSDSQFALRRASALALLNICNAAPSLRPPRADLTAFAATELSRPARHLKARSQFEQRSPFLLDARGNDISSSLELALILLAVDGEVEQLKLALAAITSEDKMQRGTGLEYLDNLLPRSVRDRLIALAEHPELTQADLRVESEVVEELADELRARRIGVRELRRRYRRARREQYERVD